MIGKTAHNQWFRYLVLTLKGVALVLALAVGTVFALAVSNRGEVPRMVEQVVEESTGATVFFTDYHFAFVRSFPFLSLVLENVMLHDPGYPDHQRELFRVDKLSVTFHFWPLFRRKLTVRSLLLEGGQATLFRSADGRYFNAGFLKGNKEKKPPAPGKPPVFSLHRATLKDFSFLLLDSLHKKLFHIDFLNTQANFRETVPGGMIHVRGEWFFHGLAFKFKNGPYLENQQAHIDWRLEWDHEKKRLRIGQSILKVADETFFLSGFLNMGDPAYLKLVIDHPGILMETGRRLIAENIRHGLRNYSLDRPVEVQVVVEGPLVPGKPAPATVAFKTEDATGKFGAIDLAHTSFSGKFFNCDPDGVVNPHSGCLRIDTFSTQLFKTLPLTGNAFLKDLADPYAEVEAAFTMPFEELSPLLPPGKIQPGAGSIKAALRLAGKMGKEALEKGDSLRLDGALALENAALAYIPTGMKLDRINAALQFRGRDLFIQQLQGQWEDSPLRITGKIHDLLPFILSSDRPVKAALAVKTAKLDVDQLLPPGRSGPVKAKGTRQKGDLNQIAAVIQDLLSRINAEITIEAEKLNIRGYTAAQVFCRSRFLSTCRVAGRGGCLLLDTLRANIYDRIPIAVSARLTDLQSPYMNLKMQVGGPLTAFNPLLPSNIIRLNDGILDLAFEYDGPLEAYFNPSEDYTAAGMKGAVALQDASVDYLSRFQVREADIDLHFDEKDLRLKGKRLMINGNELTVGGQVHDFIPFLFSEEGDLRAALDIISPNLNFNSFPIGEKTSEEGEPEKAEKNNLLSSKLKEVTGHLQADLRVQTGKVLFHAFEAEDVRITGKYKTRCGSSGPATGCVEVDTFSARLFGNAPFKANFQVENLLDPFISADAQVAMPLKDLNVMFPPDQFRFHEGSVELKFKYWGKPHDHFDFQKDLVKAHLSGSVRFEDGAIEYVPKGYHLRDLDASLFFADSNVRIERMDLKLNDNPLTLQGEFTNLLPFLFVRKEKALEASFAVSSPEFSFDRFTAPSKHAGKSYGKDYNPTPVTEIVQQILDSLKVDFDLSIDRLNYRKFSARKVYADVRMESNLVQVREARMEMEKGKLHIAGNVANLEGNAPHLDLSARFQDTEISHLFHTFDNFGQEGITHRNLSGLLNAELSFKAVADSNYDLDPQSMQGTFYLRMEEGEVTQLPSLAQLSKAIVKERHLEEIRFGKLEKKFRLKDRLLLIDGFEIASSALSFRVDGIFDLEGGGKTDLLFEIPLGNLFETDLTQNALDHYFERNHGPAVLLQMKRKKGDLGMHLIFTKKKHQQTGKQ